MASLKEGSNARLVPRRARDDPAVDEAPSPTANASPARPLPAVDWDTLAHTLRPENSPGFLLWQVANHWQRMQRQALETIGITHVQFILLAGLGFLEARDTAVSQARLATFCRTDAMMTSQVIRSLERSGLVARTDHPGDKRAKRLSLTDKGADTLNRAMPAVLRADSDFFGRIGDGKGDFVETLRHLIRCLGT